MLIKFTTDFANNWKAGDIVEARYLGKGEILVDDVARIDTALLLKHCRIISKSEDEVMADIELVIKIPEDVYRYAKKYNGSSMLTLRERKIGMCMNAIANGIPLPKGHGRLIDADELKNYYQTGLENVKPLFKTEKYCKLAIDITQGIIADVDEMEPIIEADKEDE